MKCADCSVWQDKTGSRVYVRLDFVYAQKIRFYYGLCGWMEKSQRGWRADSDRFAFIGVHSRQKNSSGKNRTDVIGTSALLY